ncbi:hypothetical protein STENM223S_09262 [Streptomyces tendae]
MTQAGEYGWTHPHALAGLLAGVLLLTAFVLIERRVAAPLVPLGTLGRRNVAFGNLLGLLAFVTETSLVYLLTLYLQKTLGFSPRGRRLLRRARRGHRRRRSARPQAARQNVHVDRAGRRRPRPGGLHRGPALPRYDDGVSSPSCFPPPSSAASATCW